MNDAANVMDFDALVMLPGAEYKRLAKQRERQRRERKIELYSPRGNKQKASK